jgi:hypothetical protein
VKRVLAVCLFLILAGNAIDASGQQIAMFPSPNQTVVGLGVASMFLQPADFRATGTVQGLPLSASGRLSLTPGPAITLIASYSLSEHFAMSAQAGYTRAELDRFDGSLSTPITGQIATSSALRGNQGSVDMFLNGIFIPWGTRNPFVFIVGGGLGFAATRVSFQSATLLGNSLQIGSVSRAVSPALDALAALEYRITANDNIGLGYQLFIVSSNSLGTGGGLTATTGVQYAHFIGIFAEHRF